MVELGFIKKPFTKEEAITMDCQDYTTFQAERKRGQHLRLDDRGAIQQLLNTFMNTLKRVELIVVDEIGFVPLHKDAAELLF